MLNAGFAILLELVGAIRLDTAGTDHFNSEIWGPFHRLVANEVQVVFKEKQNIWPAYVELIQNRINVLIELTESMLGDMVPEKNDQLDHNEGMTGYRTRAHGHLSIHKLQPNAGRILPQQKELAGGHFGRADGAHTELIAVIHSIVRFPVEHERRFTSPDAPALAGHRESPVASAACRRS